MVARRTLPPAAPPDPIRHATRFWWGRRWCVTGDRIVVRPSRPHKRDGFTGVVRYARLDPDTLAVVHVTVTGGPAGRTAWHTVTPDRIARITPPAPTKGSP
jgi:hypothetical protein